MVTYTVTCAPTVGLDVLLFSSTFSSSASTSGIADESGATEATDQGGTTISTNNNTLASFIGSTNQTFFFSFTDTTNDSPENGQTLETFVVMTAATSSWDGQLITANEDDPPQALASSFRTTQKITHTTQVASETGTTTQTRTFSTVTGTTYATTLDSVETTLPSTTTAQTTVKTSTASQTLVTRIVTTTAEDVETFYVGDGVSRYPSAFTATVFVPDAGDARIYVATQRPSGVTALANIVTSASTAITVLPVIGVSAGDIQTISNISSPPYTSSGESISDYSYTTSISQSMQLSVANVTNPSIIPITETTTIQAQSITASEFAAQITQTTYEGAVFLTAASIYSTQSYAAEIGAVSFQTTQKTTGISQTLKSSRDITAQAGLSTNGYILWQSENTIGFELFSDAPRKVLQAESSYVRAFVTPANSQNAGQIISAGNVSASLVPQFFKASQTAWMPPLFTSWSYTQGGTTVGASADAVGLSVTSAFSDTVVSGSAAWEIDGDAVLYFSVPTAHTAMVGGKAPVGNISATIPAGWWATSSGTESGSVFKAGISTLTMNEDTPTTAFRELPMAVGGNQRFFTTWRNYDILVP